MMSWQQKDGKETPNQEVKLVEVTLLMAEKAEQILQMNCCIKKTIVTLELLAVDVTKKQLILKLYNLWVNLAQMATMEGQQMLKMMPPVLLMAVYCKNMDQWRRVRRPVTLSDPYSNGFNILLRRNQMALFQPDPETEQW